MSLQRSYCFCFLPRPLPLLFRFSTSIIIIVIVVLIALATVLLIAVGVINLVKDIKSGEHLSFTGFCPAPPPPAPTASIYRNWRVDLTRWWARRDLLHLRLAGLRITTVVSSIGSFLFLVFLSFFGVLFFFSCQCLAVSPRFCVLVLWALFEFLFHKNFNYKLSTGTKRRRWNLSSWNFQL